MTKKKFFNRKLKAGFLCLAVALLSYGIVIGLAACRHEVDDIEGGNIPTPPQVVIWTTDDETGFPDGGRINAVAYGGGKFVAVGDSGKAAYSDDGITWIPVEETTFYDTHNEGIDIEAIAYGGGKFVAVGGGGKAAYSSNGITWQAADTNLGDFHINAIAYSGKRFVAGGDEAAYSDDGITWMAANTQFGFSIEGIAYGNGKFVAAGDNKDDKDPIAAGAAYSDNGITWEEVDDTKFGDFYSVIKSVAFGGGTFVAVGGDGKAAYSSDGERWTAVNDTQFNVPDDSGGGIEGLSINQIAFGGGKFVAVGNISDGEGGNFGAASYSNDGVTWFAVTDTKFASPDEPQSKTSLNGIGYGDGKFIAVGYLNNAPTIAYWEPGN